jgi:hypothetical protein
MRDAGEWLEKSGKNPSKWWQLDNLNNKFLLQYAKPEEFYVSSLHPLALCVYRIAGQGLPQLMVDFVAQKAKEQGVSLLRADTNASENKLRKVYQDLGFKLVKILDEDYRKTAFYERDLS